MTRRRPGPQPKGERDQLTLRLPAAHKALYRDEASAKGLPLGDYLATVLARAHDLDEPGYLTTDKTTPMFEELQDAM